MTQTTMTIPAKNSGSPWSALARRAFRRLMLLLCVFLGITVISFAVIHLAPGSPVDLETTMNPLADQDARARLQKLYGLDKPLHIQYGNWLVSLVKLDFGNSLSGDRRPVLTLIGERLPLTVGMNVVALFLTLCIAIPLGCFSARYRGSPFDFSITVFVFIGFAMPGFWLALILIQYCAIEWQLFPISGLTSLNFASLSTWDKTLDLARHLALPIAVYTFGSLAQVSRFMRSSMLEVLRQDYITTARAKGLSGRVVLFGHALRNALLPVITLLGLSIPGLIGGSVIIETIFALPGLGQLFYSAVMMRDYPLIMGNLVLGAFLTLAGNLVADLCYGVADPRIRSGADNGGAGGAS
ncbi:Oligopeptide transport system permease protein AppB [uncultured delta proteobacterium]|uniref:Oligopeptide transport system permease protein AppB n=1 Tax=uncultured delta proteobacterium TaxID=34034 RepID=A0A212JLH6_9DELT|nr:Oligopeptide transport system permease protein AppB [uncultured delta proteobacterium]